MTREEKDLVLHDLCARLPYGVMVQDDIGRTYKLNLGNAYLADLCYGNGCYMETPIKPYLRPMSSMTEEEKEKLLAKLPTKWNIEIDKFEDFYFDICEECAPDIELFTDIIDWLNKKMFDYRGLIPKGHAIAVTKNNNPYEV